MDALEGLRAAMAQVGAFYKERGIFQGRFGFGRCPALVVIDMAYGWTDPAYAGGSARLDAADEAYAPLMVAMVSASSTVTFWFPPHTRPR